jgi:hypothetical protein
MSLATSLPAAATQALVELYCRELKLPGLRTAYPAITREAQAQAQSYPAFLAACLAQEVQSRREHRLAHRLRQARFPAAKSLAEFDFLAQPQLPKLQILALADGGFVKARENVICLGNPGTGKTHVAIGLAAAALAAGYRVRFISAISLCWPPNRSIACRATSRAGTASIWSCSTNWVTSASGPAARCCSSSAPSATSAAAWC